MTNLLKMLIAAAVFCLISFPAIAQDGVPPDGGPHGEKMMRHGSYGLEKLDTDGDGNVSKAEFIAESERKFAELDSNSDGMISKEEIEARRAAWQAKAREHRQNTMQTKPADAANDSAPAEAPRQ